MLYIDMRLVDGRDLRTLLKADGRLPPDRAVAILLRLYGTGAVRRRAGMVVEILPEAMEENCASHAAHLHPPVRW